MTAITTSEARRELFGLIERVNQDHTEVEILSKHGSAVLMSKDEYDALVETSYLLRSPENARRLLSSLAEARSGQITEHELQTDESETARKDVDDLTSRLGAWIKNIPPSTALQSIIGSPIEDLPKPGTIRRE